MTKYIFKGKEISHTSFLSLCRKAGLQNPRNRSIYNQLQTLAEKGNWLAANIQRNLKVIE